MKEFINFLKLPPSILAAIAMGTGLILFLPLNILQKLALDNIPELWNTILGLSFIISTAILVIYCVSKISAYIFSRLRWVYFKKKFNKTMGNLRYEELATVALLYRSQNYTSRLPLTDGVTIRLINKMVIQHTSATSLTYGDNLLIPFTITPIAQEYIDKHPELIEGFDKPLLQSMYDRYNNPYSGW